MRRTDRDLSKPLEHRTAIVSIRFFPTCGDSCSKVYSKYSVSMADGESLSQSKTRKRSQFYPTKALD